MPKHTFGALPSLLFMAVIWTACGPQAIERRSRTAEIDPTNGDAEPVDPIVPPAADGSDAGDESVGLTGAELYGLYCQSCHMPLEATQKPARTAVEIDAAIKSVPQMGSLVKLTPEEIALIAEALDPHAQAKTPTHVFSLQLTNRFVASAKFNKIFVADSPSAADAPIQAKIKSLITDSDTAFGGVCTIYDQGCTGQTPSMVRQNPGTGVQRQALHLRACEEVLAIEAALDNALARSSLTATTAVSSTAVRQAALIAFSGAVIDDAALAALTELGTAAAGMGLGVRDQWRYVFVALCQSPEWSSL